MTPTEFVDGLAHVMGVERTEIATVDRALAKNGLRNIARGRSRPDITLAEGVQLACAWAGTKSRTLAADEVERLKNFHALIELPSDRTDVFTDLSGVEPEELDGTMFLDVVAMVARQLGTLKYPAEEVWIMVEKQGGADIRYKVEDRQAGIRFFQASKKFEFKGPPDVNVSVKVAIRGPVLKWIYDVTEGC